VSDRRTVAAALNRATGRLATAATARMESDLAWFRALSADDRSWVGLIVQAGVRGFVEWYAAGPETKVAGSELAMSMFSTAPRALTGVITLRHTVDLVRLSIDVVEANIGDLLEPADAADVQAAISRYARAAEQRGAWDARLEALVVDAVLRDETDEALLSRASALGWTSRDVVVVVGELPDHRSEADLVDAVRRTAQAHHLEALCAVQGEQLVVLLGGVRDARVETEPLARLFGPGPVVVGPIADDLTSAHRSAAAALAGHRAAVGWPDAPRPVLAGELLPERALAGDEEARHHLAYAVHGALTGGRATLEETLRAYFDAGGGLEATARRLFVHPNTVRYRLRQVADLTGLSPTEPRDAFALRIALVLGRLEAGL